MSDLSPLSGARQKSDFGPSGRLLDPTRTFDTWMSPLRAIRYGDTQQGHAPMRRRYLIAIIAGIAALPLAALAQQAVPSIAPQVHEEMWAIPSSPVPMLAYLIRPAGTANLSSVCATSSM